MSYEMHDLPAFLHELTGDGDKPSLEYATEIFRILENRKVKKKDVLVRIGQVPKEVYFIKKGILKASIIDGKGNLYTYRFSGKGDALTAIAPFIFQEESKVQVECVTACELQVLNYDDYFYMTRLYPGLEAAFYKLVIKKYDDLLEEKSKMINQDASTKYHEFIRNYAPIIDHLPLKEIASFLGIRQQSLSRLRSKIYK